MQAPPITTPDDAWLQEYHIPLRVETYGDVLYTTLPAALEAIERHNTDKRALQEWKRDLRPEDGGAND